MSFITKKPKTIAVTVQINVHAGAEEATANQVQQILTRATPDEIAQLSRLFADEGKRKMAISMAGKYL